MDTQGRLHGPVAIPAVRKARMAAFIAAVLARVEPYGDFATLAEMAEDMAEHLVQGRKAYQANDDSEAYRHWRIAESRLSVATGRLVLSNGPGDPFLKMRG